MTPSATLVAFLLDQYRYAVYLSVAQRVVRAVEITPLPRAPNIVLGVINVQGEIVPVVNVRRRFDLPEREIEPNDQLLLARASRRLVALAADAVIGVIECPPSSVIVSERVLPGLEYVEGVVKLEDGLVLIHDLDKFLSLEEEGQLDSALSEPSP